MHNKNDFLLLQINDALFPIGGYSHSYGLETYIQKDIIKNADDAALYIEEKLSNSLFYTELLSVKLAYKYSLSGNVDRLKSLEAKLRAAKTPKEIRLAAQKLGSRFVKTVSGWQTDDKSTADISNTYIKEVKQPSHSVAYGVFCASAGVDKAKTLETYLYAQTSAMVTNCVKTIPLSQTQGQKILYDCHELFETLLEKLENTSEDMLCLSCPGFDIRCMQHERLYSRLYMS